MIVLIAYCSVNSSHVQCTVFGSINRRGGGDKDGCREVYGEVVEGWGSLEIV